MRFLCLAKEFSNHSTALFLVLDGERAEGISKIGVRFFAGIPLHGTGRVTKETWRAELGRPMHRSPLISMFH